MKKELNVLGTLAMVLNDEVRNATNALIGMSGETVSAIVMLGANPGLTVGQVAQALALTPSGAVRLVDRLAAEGVLDRQPGVDQRTVTLALTKAGERIRLQALAERERIIRKATEGLSHDEIAILGGLLERMLGNLMVQADQDYRFCRMCDEDACEPNCPVEACRARLADICVVPRK